MICSWSIFQTCCNSNYLEQQICLFSCSWEFLVSVAHDALRNKGEGRKDKKIDDYIHGIVHIFLRHHQGVLQRRYGQNSLNISIILYRNPASHSYMEHEIVVQTDCDGELHCCHDDCSLVLNQMPAPNVGWFTLSPWRALVFFLGFFVCIQNGNHPYRKM
jgi:hypothetical protein